MYSTMRRKPRLPYAGTGLDSDGPPGQIGDSEQLLDPRFTLFDPMWDDGLRLVTATANWGERLAATDVDSQLRAIREATSTGRPCGSEDFVNQLEGKLGRSLKPRRRGRKPQVSDASSKCLF